MSINTREILYRSMQFSVSSESKIFKLFTAAEDIFRIGCTVKLSDSTTFYVEVDNNLKATLRNISRPSSYTNYGSSYIAYKDKTFYLMLGVASTGITLKTDIIFGSISSDVPASVSSSSGLTKLISIDFNYTDTIQSISNTSIKSENIETDSITSNTLNASTVTVSQGASIGGNLSLTGSKSTLTVSGNINTEGDTAANNLTVNKDATISGNATIGGDVYVSNNINLKNLNFSSASTDGYTVDIDGGKLTFTNTSGSTIDTVNGVLINPYVTISNNMSLCGNTIMFPNNIDILVTQASSTNSTLFTLLNGSTTVATLKTGSTDENIKNFVFHYNFDTSNSGDITYIYNSKSWTEKTLRLPEDVNYTVSVSDSSLKNYFTKDASVLRILYYKFNNMKSNYLVTSKALDILIGSSEYTTNNSVGNLNKGENFNTSTTASANANGVLYQSEGTVTNILPHPSTSTNKFLMQSNSGAPSWGDPDLTLSASGTTTVVKVGDSVADITVPYASSVGMAEVSTGSIPVLLGSSNTVYTNNNLNYDASKNTLSITNGDITLNGKSVLTSYVDTKDTAGTSQFSSSTAKLFIVGASSQGDPAETYTSSNAFVKNGALYSEDRQTLTMVSVPTATSSSHTLGYGDKFVAVTGVSTTNEKITYVTEEFQLPSSDDTNTKNTAGATSTSNKIYLVGATEQTDNPQTYTNSNVYISGNYVYSNSEKEDVTGLKSSTSTYIKKLRDGVLDSLKSAFTLSDGILTVDITAINSIGDLNLDL